MSSTARASPTMQGSSEPDFFVSDWRVRPALGRLERNGTSVSVEPRTMQVLTCLVRHAPNVVSRERLMDEVWGEIWVSDEAITQAVCELRKAFGDEAKNPRYIETLARRGYRLVAEVSREPVAGARVANYEILKPMASGAMGEVYKAKELRLGRTVTLKLLPADLCRDPGAKQQFKGEAQALAQLDHPNLATIYDIGETGDGRMFLALGFYDGETLQQKLERGPLPIPEAVGIACQIAKGLAAAHRRQIVHRDIKPANLVVLPDGTVKILDLELAEVIGATTLTGPGSSPGTPAYKSPEQTRGEKVDSRSDLWALGVVLYEMVTGQVHAILNQPLPPLDHLPAELAAVIERALAKEAASRYQTAEEMEADLVGDPGGIGHQKMATPGRWSDLHEKEHRRVLRPVRRKWRLIVFCTIVALGIGLGVWSWSTKRNHSDPSAQVEQFIEQGDEMEWHGDTERILGNAENTYRRALALDPENPMAMAYLAALLARTQLQFPKKQRLAEIRQLTAEAVEHAPDHPMPWVAKATLLLLENKPVDAELAARNAVAQDREFDRGYTALGEALIRQGQLEKGLEEIRHGTEVGKGNLRGRLVLAIRLRQASRDDEAEIELRKVLNLEPYHPNALHALGEIYLKTGREDEALDLLRMAFALGEWHSANSLGNFDLKRGQDREALRYFIEAYRISHHPVLAHNLAEAYEKLGRTDEARRWYKVAVEWFDYQLAQGGSRADLLYSRSLSTARLGDFDHALADIQEAIRLKPNDNRFLVRAAEVYLLAGRRQEAFDYLWRAVQEGVSKDDILSDFVFQPYLDDPQFRAILESDYLEGD